MLSRSETLQALIHFADRNDVLKLKILSLAAFAVCAGSVTKVVGRQFLQPARLAMIVHKSLHGFRFDEEPSGTLDTF